MVDDLAKKAAETLPLYPIAWHRDLARVYTKGIWDAGISDIIASRSTFLQHLLPDDHPYLQKWSPSVKALPPLRMSIPHVKIINQIRSGIWAALGAHTFMTQFRGDGLHPCPVCKRMIPVDHGGMIAHLIACSTDINVPKDALWSPNAWELRRMVMHAQQFIGRTASRSPSADFSDVEDEMARVRELGRQRTKGPTEHLLE